MNPSGSGPSGSPWPAGNSGPGGYGPQAYPPQQLPPGVPPPMQHPPPRPGRFPWGVLALIFGIIALLASIIPFAGAIGLFAIVLGLVELLGGEPGPQPGSGRGMGVAGLIMGVLGCGAAAIWVVIIATSSCPHVYTYDGTDYRLDADPLSGSFLEAAASTDWDRLEHLAEVEGQYRLRVANERRERDFVDSLALLVVDHEPDALVVPTQSGELVALSSLAAPLGVSDSLDRDLRELVREADDERWVSRLEDLPEEPASDPREWLVVEFPRPAARETVLLFRGRGTAFAAEAFARYLAHMGPGLGTLLEWSQCSEDYPFRDRVRDEMRRLGLVIDVELWNGTDWVRQTEIRPIGPAVVRDQAVRLELPEGETNTVRVRLAMTPRFCEIDRLALELAPVAVATPTRLEPAGAVGVRGADTKTTLASRDGVRLRLDEGQSTDVVFLAPAAPEAGVVRTVVLEVSGYYSFDIGGRGWLNPLAIWRHRNGHDSLPRFAARLAREQAAAR
jgi:hypothetical protein